MILQGVAAALPPGTDEEVIRITAAWIRHVFPHAIRRRGESDWDRMTRFASRQLPRGPSTEKRRSPLIFAVRNAVREISRLFSRNGPADRAGRRRLLVDALAREYLLRHPQATADGMWDWFATLRGARAEELRKDHGEEVTRSLARFVSESVAGGVTDETEPRHIWEALSELTGQSGPTLRERWKPYVVTALRLGGRP